jgi:hypothetical protein
MAKSNAERQAAYRARHLKDENGTGLRLNLVIDAHAKWALERLAVCSCERRCKSAQIWRQGRISGLPCADC